MRLDWNLFMIGFFLGFATASALLSWFLRSGREDIGYLEHCLERAKWRLAMPKRNPPEKNS